MHSAPCDPSSHAAFRPFRGAPVPAQPRRGCLSACHTPATRRTTLPRLLGARLPSNAARSPRREGHLLRLPDRRVGRNPRTGLGHARGRGSGVVERVVVKVDDDERMVKRGSALRVRQRASHLPLLRGQFRCSSPGVGASLRRPRSVHRVYVGCFAAHERVEQLDGVLATVAREVALVAVDRGQAGTHVAQEVEG
jgi:hypothetical protein